MWENSVAVFHMEHVDSSSVIEDSGNYNYDLTVHEERYNVVVFASGNCGLMYSR